MTTELLGEQVFIMVMATFYSYVIIFHTERHTNTVYKIQLLFFGFFTYESQPSVPPVAETESFGSRYSSLIPLGAIQKPLSKRTKKYSQLLFFLQE